MRYGMLEQPSRDVHNKRKSVVSLKGTNDGLDGVFEALIHRHRARGVRLVEAKNACEMKTRPHHAPLPGGPLTLQ